MTGLLPSVILETEKKMHVIEQPLPPAPEAGAKPNIVLSSVKRDMPDKRKKKDLLSVSFIDTQRETMVTITNFPPLKKIVVARYAEFFEKRFISQEISRREVDLEEIQEEEDRTPSEITSNIPQEVGGFERPQEEVIPIRDLNEPLANKAQCLDLESNKWIDARMRQNTIHDGPNMYGPGRSPPGCKTVGASGFLRKRLTWRDNGKALIGLGQNAYMDKILKRYKMDNSKRCIIPMQERLDLNKSQGAQTPKENLGEPHWTAVKNILKYLRNTKDMFLVYGGNPSTKLRTRKAPSKVLLKALLHKLNYIAASEAEMEVVWIRKFISGVGIVPTINEPIKMFCDNFAALLIANEPGVQMGAGHYHRSNLLKVHTDDNLAYPFMKALPKGKLTQHARSMGLRLASSFISLRTLEKEWGPGTSLLQLLQILEHKILNTNPLFNGLAMTSDMAGDWCSLLYNENIFIMSLKTMVHTMNRPPKHFESFVAGHFINRARDILLACKSYKKGQQVGFLACKDNKVCSMEFRKDINSCVQPLVKAFKKIGSQVF
ncbi:retrotransposon protein, putative, ty1-copia subclass [Tanacetum coccineum]